MYHLYTDMPLIEGVGDEVTVVFTIFLLLAIVCIAWISTNIQELPFFSVIVIEFTRRQNRNQQSTSTTEVTDTSTPSLSSSEESLTDQSSQEEATTSSPSGSSQNEQSVESNSQISIENKDINVNNSKSNSSTNENNESAETSNDATGETIQDSDDLPASETELRQRRLAFFSGKSPDAEKENDDQITKDSCAESLSKSCSSANVKNKTDNETVSENLNINSSQNETTELLNNTEESGQNDRVRIRLKYLNETQRNVEASLDDTIEQFRRANFAEEIADNKLVRFIFNGQDLRIDSNTLQAYNIVDNSVIHCLITQANRQNVPTGVEEDDSFDVGMLMLPCFGIILCFTWYLRLEYRQFFSGTSTVCLIGITLLFIAAMLATWENRRRGPPHIHVD